MVLDWETEAGQYLCMAIGCIILLHPIFSDCVSYAGKIAMVVYIRLSERHSSIAHIYCQSAQSLEHVGI